MSARRNLIHGVAVAVVAGLTWSVLPAAVRADDASPASAAPAEQQDATQTFTGTVNADDVYVRSGPSDKFYATLKLDKGATVTVVGIKNDWLKIVPPEGSFCYVAKVFVDKRGDGTVGRVTKPDLNVRAGSTLNAMKITVQTKLQDGMDVQILGEQDEYFKIKPPAGAYLYVSKDFVTPSLAANGAGATPVVATAGKSAVSTPATPVSTSGAPIASAPLVTSTPATPAAGQAAAAIAASAAANNASPATRPAVAVADAATTQPSVASATTQPAEPGILDQFNATEAAFLDASNKPLDAQPIGDLTRQYAAISSSSDTPVTIKRLAELRLKTLGARQEARLDYDQTLKMEAAAKSKEDSYRSEQHELEDRVKSQDVTMYTAVGTLRASSLQPVGGTLYRLTDPGNGRTLLYLRSDDPKYAMLLNQFIGVRGAVTEDAAMNLSVISPTLAEPVDQKKINTTVTAEHIPPTLLPHAVQGD